jgi:hypothetical protein
MVKSLSSTCRTYIESRILDSHCSDTNHFIRCTVSIGI